MRVYVFENQTGRFVFAASSKPAKLPPELGPWTLFSSFELSTIGKWKEPTFRATSWSVPSSRMVFISAPLFTSVGT